MASINKNANSTINATAVFSIPETATLREAVQKMDAGGRGIIVAVDATGKATGLLTDGDFRRAILKGTELETPLVKVMNREFSRASTEEPAAEIYERLKRLHRRHIPVLDGDGKFVALRTLDDLEFPSLQDTLVVMMVGGRGARLGTLTENCPKPMLEIGGKPLLQRLVEQMAAQGIGRFVFCINYLGEMIQSHFGDGSAWGVDIRYTRENQPLGTAGALRLLPERPKAPFIVMNGDILTKVNFSNMLEFHREQDAPITIATRQYQVSIPFGVLEHEEGRIKGITEKPVTTYITNAGIYILNPECLDFLPESGALDMPDFVKRIMAAGGKPMAFAIHEEWVDIGRREDLDFARTLDT